MKDLTNLIPSSIKQDLRIKKYTVLDPISNHMFTFSRNIDNKWYLTKIGGQEVSPEDLEKMLLDIKNSGNSDEKD